MQTRPILSSVQRKVATELLEGISPGAVLMLEGDSGTGKTMILRQINNICGGGFVSAGELLGTFAGRPPVSAGEAFLRVVEDAVHSHDLVLVDDLHLFTYLCRNRSSAIRYLFDAALTALLGEACAFKKTLIFAGKGEPPWSIARRALVRRLAP